MSKYHKIQSVYRRDERTNFKTLLVGEYSEPEFAYLANLEWTWTEKVDGMNIRIMFDDVGGVTFGGKTDRAQIPSDLVNRLNERANGWKPTADFSITGVTLYGEGYGPKIQKPGGLYRDDQDFVLFDVRAGQTWLKREDVEKIGFDLGLDVVPIVGHGTLPEMAEKARRGFDSTWGAFPAEGIVARPATELRTRMGRRIITKIKTRDFV